MKNDLMDEKIRGLWAQTGISVWDATYWMVAFEHSEIDAVLQLLSKNDEANFRSCIFDNHEISVLLTEKYWFEQRKKLTYRDEFGPLCGITLDIPLDIEVSGYLRPAVEQLASAGISIIPQCALIYDHLFVSQKDLEKAIAILKDIQKHAQDNQE